MYSRAWSTEEEEFIDQQIAQIKKDHPKAKGQVPFAYLRSLLINTTDASKNKTKELLPNPEDLAFSNDDNQLHSEISVGNSGGEESEGGKSNVGDGAGKESKGGDAKEKLTIRIPAKADKTEVAAPPAPKKVGKAEGGKASCSIKKGSTHPGNRRSGRASKV
ncbi:hypothetical protein PCASD_22105 [Puccinia coronata f. sp. avenae]|uniref:Uncharacterized protein n=1 Tax=Puccinia coronata f. sp. avenae TaxID=200324 RepID=A0A2N5SX09_9BASI|nr:hypothetical protein PCASD_22105 [Puccinia coronata f. sp. avenae]